ncbi:MAG: LptF/LptG family permease [Ahrensia sp.]|nr:LptF/LptG family permease [Ahrensia sp.]
MENARIFGVETSAFEMQYYSLLSLPGLMVAMTLIGATVSLRFVRFGVSPAMVLGGIIAGFVLYVLVKVTSSFGGAGIISPIIAAWLPVLVSGLFGVVFLLHREDG